MRTVFVALGFLLLVVCCEGKRRGYNKCYKGYEKIGCFRDSRRNRALPHLILTGRDRRSRVFDGHRIDWRNFGKYISGLACRCAAKARQLGYKFFGLQYYGECWAGNGNYGKYGRANSKRCWKNTPVRPPYYCNDGDKKPCVGGPNTNYVYRFKPRCVRNKLSWKSCHYLLKKGQCRSFNIAKKYCCKTCKTVPR